MIAKCTCACSWMDKALGQGLREHNLCLPEKRGKGKVFTQLQCVVCGAQKPREVEVKL
jgi:hypothetical protein